MGYIYIYIYISLSLSLTIPFLLLLCLLGPLLGIMEQFLDFVASIDLGLGFRVLL